MESSGLGVGVRLICKAEMTSTWEFEEPLYPSLQNVHSRDVPCELVRVNAPSSLVEPLHVYLHAALSKEKDLLGKWRALFMRYYQSERKLWDSAFLRFEPQYRLKQIEGIFKKVKRGNVAKKPVVRVSAVVALQRGGGPGSRQVLLLMTAQDCRPGLEQNAGGAAEEGQREDESAGLDAAIQRSGPETLESGQAEAAFARPDAGSLGEHGSAGARRGEKHMVGAPKEENVGKVVKSGSGGPNSAVASTSSCQAASGIEGGVNGAAGSLEYESPIGDKSLRMLTVEEREMLQMPDAADAVGSGSYGTVYEVLIEGGSSWASVFPDRVGTRVAVKEYRGRGLTYHHSTVYTVQNLSYEVILASAFSHDNVVKPFAVCIGGSGLPLAFFPYFNQGSLGSVLQKRDDRSLEKPLAKIMRKAKVLTDL
ncbi:hypothetical protein KFL_001560290 [Klebsormidium nitens]|uniref:Protein kinase domain-containing protein n=1 Tax=Klebsormidium nitens TaxID=105231 RepID=A0A1Y1HYA6_KLENI|nr:hypothetical protein KFL_001560290 [Klebsormidium nitens]|eukprot:GAQ83660.1 hypothetical protein KFL_001560290 [Klebsormidium nitens]